MENKLIKNKKSEIELTEDGLKLVKNMIKTKIKLQQMEDELKELFLENMEKTGVVKYTSPDGNFTATYYAETTTNSIDSKSLKAENPRIYNKYLKTSKRKAYVRFS